MAPAASPLPRTARNPVAVGLGKAGGPVQHPGMSSKSGKVSGRVAGLDPRGWDPRYAGWFECFNAGEYYEAHDVLEDLWLEQGRDAPDHAFHKALIQVAGAFVHARKGRPGPAAALLRLARSYLGRYPAWHQGLDVGDLVRRCAAWEQGVTAHGPAAMLETGPPVVELAPRRG